MSNHRQKQFKRLIIGRTWLTTRKIKKTVRLGLIVRKHQVETVKPYLVLDCNHAIPAKNYSGEYGQAFAYCKQCYNQQK